MIGTWEILMDYIGNSGLQVTFAAIWITGMLVGAALAFGWQEIWRWFVAVLPVVIFEEIARRIILTSIGQIITMRPLILATMVFGFYFVGALVGAVIIERVRRPFLQEHRRLREEIADALELSKR